MNEGSPHLILQIGCSIAQNKKKIQSVKRIFHCRRIELERLISLSFGCMEAVKPNDNKGEEGTNLLIRVWNLSHIPPGRKNIERHRLAADVRENALRWRRGDDRGVNLARSAPRRQMRPLHWPPKPS